MKKNLSRIEIEELAEVLASKPEVKSFVVSYAMEKTLNHCISIIKNTNKAKQKNTEYKKYNDKRIELAKKHARKDDNGKASLIPGTTNYNLENPVAFSEEFKKLKEEYKDIIKRHNDFMEEEVEIDIHTIKITEFPEDLDIRGMSILVEE